MRNEGEEIGDLGTDKRLQRNKKCNNETGEKVNSEIGDIEQM